MSENEYIKPQSGGQTKFLSSTAYEVLFGGAAGPGKSWALIIDALGLQYKNTKLGMAAIECPDYRAVLFRRKTTQFSKLLDEGKKYYPILGGELILKRTGDPGPSFNFPSGARIFICHMEQEDNKEDHQGQEYQYVGFDELTQFTITQYTYLFSRLRNTVPGLFTRIRATTNPTGSGLLWVKKRFIKSGNLELTPGKVYNFEPPESDIKDDPMGKLVEKKSTISKTRQFIPGKLDENKILSEYDPNYALNIKLMGKQYEEALLNGDWDAFGGDFFADFNGRLMKKDPFEIPQHWKLIGSLDPGWSSPCSFSLHASDENGIVYTLFTYYEAKISPQEHAQAIKKRIDEFPWTRGRMPNIIVSGTDAFAKKEKYAIEATERTVEDVFLREGLVLTPAKTDRILGWMAWKQLMRLNKWFYFDFYNDHLINELSSVESDERQPEDIKGRGNDPNVPDHALDQVRYGLMSLFKAPEAPKEEIPLARPFVNQINNKIDSASF